VTTVPPGARVTVPWRTILAAIGLAAAAYLLWLFVLATQREITWLVVAGFFAVVLSPLVDFLVQRARIRRTLAALIVFVVGFATLGGLLYLLIRPIVDEVNKLVNDFPRLVQDAQAGRGPIGHVVKRYDLVHRAQQYAPKLKQYVSSSGSKALSILRRIGDGVVSALTILVLTFLLLVEGPKVLEGATSLVNPQMQTRLKRMGHNASRAISGYMLGNILISLIASGVTYVALWAFGVPFRGVAALWVGFADLIPLVGATLGAVPTVGLSFLHSVPAGIGMIVVYVVYQQFENHVIQVAIMSRTVRLSPLGVLVSLLVGVQLFGLLGALLAIPAAGIIHVVGAELYRERQSRRGLVASSSDDGGEAAGPGGDGREAADGAATLPPPVGGEAAGAEAVGGEAALAEAGPASGGEAGAAEAGRADDELAGAQPGPAAGGEVAGARAAGGAGGAGEAPPVRHEGVRPHHNGHADGPPVPVAAAVPGEGP
jgi:predicted PurR-regulated permease PerM